MVPTRSALVMRMFILALANDLRYVVDDVDVVVDRLMLGGFVFRTFATGVWVVAVTRRVR
jgi:hypothetical protein